MKISAWKYPGFTPIGGCQRAIVTVDGRRLERVLRADTCAGVAWIAETNADGSVKVDRTKMEVVERRIYGPIRVEIVPL